MVKKRYILALAVSAAGVLGAAVWLWRDPAVVSCLRSVAGGIPGIAETREDRFQGKAGPTEADCAGGPAFAAIHPAPWVDWQTYWAAGEVAFGAGSVPPSHPLLAALTRSGRGMLAALIDLERARIELVKFNLFDNLTHRDYVLGRADPGRPMTEGRGLETWPEMRLSETDPRIAAVAADPDTGAQTCVGEVIRFRTLTGICNDLVNPAMGSTGMPFGRNVPFEAAFPELGLTEEARNRHGDRLTAAPADPQVISRLLFTRAQSDPAACAGGYGTSCDYQKADTLNVLAGFWIQFMTHDWFTHLDEGRNGARLVPIGCDRPGQTGCDPTMQMEAALVDQDGMPPTFAAGDRTEMTRAYRTTLNLTTAWWDASQIYGYDDRSLGRVKRDPADPAKLLLVLPPERQAQSDGGGYLPVLQDCGAGAEAGCTPDPMNPKWAGQEAAAFPENWSIGTSFLHTVFVREHNIFVDAFRAHAKANPDQDSGLRRPGAATTAVPYSAVRDDEIFQIARLVVAAEIAKIHTTEWTTQLLYNEPLRTAMFSNWYGLAEGYPLLKDLLEDVAEDLRRSSDAQTKTSWYSAFAAGPGIVGSGTVDVPGTIDDVEYANGGTNHFGVPFNFTEEFVSVYRLHSLIPDLIELRSLGDPNRITKPLPVVTTFRGKATAAMREVGLADLALSFGRQRAGALTLGNHPAFLQNLDLEDPAAPGRRIDVAALDILRDRERGIPRFNEFRRQIGLQPLKSFDDFIDPELRQRDPAELTQAEAATLARQTELAATLRAVYGTHDCDPKKVISHALKLPGADPQGPPAYPDDCQGQKGKVVDNVEDIDTVVGYLAESTRPHGFAISETQFQIFIINASRRLFSDRFFTSSFRPEFYSRFGYDWVMNNGPAPQIETVAVNGHRQPVAPMKRVLLRTIPELADELAAVQNSFDPWARDRGSNYSTDWVARPDAKSDVSFSN